MSFVARSMLVCTLSLSLPQAASAQDGVDMEACLSAPTRSCALSAAVSTAVAEDLPIERARVLIAVAEALVDIGSADQAQATLALALEETRNVGISFVVQEKIKDIAPLYARLGDGSEALALADQIQVRLTRERVLSQILQAALDRGDFATAEGAISRFTNTTRAFWEELNLLAQAPADVAAARDLTTLTASVNALTRPGQRSRAFTLLAILSHKRGDAQVRDLYLEQSEDEYRRITNVSARAETAALRTSALLNAGLADGVLGRAYDQARVEGLRLRNRDDILSFARRMGPIEVARGDGDAALARLGFLDDVEAQARYLALLGPVDSFRLPEFYRGAADQVDGIDDRFERDRLRLLLVEGAVRNDQLDSALGLVRLVEDDDARAAALASLVPLLS